ncbi:MAG: hypothetical protein ACK53W_07670 [Gemmatimonadota bacterium]|jgi:hypothetical protein
MLTVICVLKSGGIYDAEWVRKLRDGVARHLGLSHRFVCLSDMDVPCERIALQHDWPGWWSKIELFRPGVVTGPTLYVDLDNLPVGDLSPLTDCPHDFAMLRNFNRPEYASSCVMWFKDKAPAQVYEKFAADPQGWMTFHVKHRDGPYLGDQAFIWDCFDRNVPFIELPALAVCSYKKDYLRLGRLPDGAAMVAFGGSMKPNTVNHKWVRQAWQ